jgi:hypothetical protein
MEAILVPGESLSEQPLELGAQGEHIVDSVAVQLQGPELGFCGDSGGLRGAVHVQQVAHEIVDRVGVVVALPH